MPEHDQVLQPNAPSIDMAPDAVSNEDGSPEEAGRTFPCEQCGSDLLFHIGAQNLSCQYCGFSKTLAYGDAAVVEQDLQAALDRIKDLRTRINDTPAEAAPSTWACGSCGATVVYEGSLTSQDCDYCGTPDQRPESKRAPDRLPIDAMLTFTVDSHVAKKAIAKWVGSRWFLPSAFKSDAQSGKIQGTYLPHFTFDAMTATAYTGERGEYYSVTVGSGENKRSETRTRWSPAAGRFQRFFDDVLVAAIRSMPTKVLRGLRPWPLEKAVPFAPEALAGKQAHTYEVELQECLPKAKSRIESELERDVRRRIGGDVQNIDDMTTLFSALTYKYMLLPIWILAYRYGDKSFRVAVNGTTGAVHGERPYSIAKILLTASLVLLLIAAGAITYMSMTA